MRLKYNSPVLLAFRMHWSAYLYFFLTGLRQCHHENVYPVQWNQFLNPWLYSTGVYIAGHVSFRTLIGQHDICVTTWSHCWNRKHGSSKTLIMLIATAVIIAILNILFLPTGLIGASGICIYAHCIGVFYQCRRWSDSTLPFILLIALLFVGKEVIKPLYGRRYFAVCAHMRRACGAIFGFTSKIIRHTNHGLVGDYIV